MEVAIFRFVITCGCLDVLYFIFARQSNAVDALDPRPLIVIRVGQINPHRCRVLEVGATFDIDLVQAAILQNEYVNHALPSPAHSVKCTVRLQGRCRSINLWERGHDFGLDAPAHHTAARGACMKRGCYLAGLPSTDGW